jgi:pimeloyl-ACP methyl ester carboxylesterase
MTAVNEHVAHVRQRTMRYLDAGDGRPCLLLHSFPLSADQWKPQFEHVPAGWRFIAPDLFGLGPGSDDRAPGSMDDQAGALLALLDGLGLENVAVAGVSMGGYAAFALLRRAPSRVSSLVLADTRATADTAEARAGRDTTSALVEREGVDAIAREMLPRLLGETTHRDRPDVVATVTHLITANRPGAVRAALQAIRDRPDSMPILSTFRGPTLILCGAEDVITPIADSEAMQRATSRSRLVVLPAAGHLSNLEAPEAFSRALEEFLR